MLVTAVSSAHAQNASFSANLGVTNNYMWRGKTQTDDDFAVQGGGDVEFENGLAVGVWASNVDFGDSTDAEIDIYGSFSFPLTEMVSASVGGIAYLYADQPTGADYNFGEINGGLELDLAPVTLGGSIAFSPDVAGETTWNFEGNASAAIGEMFEVFGALGYYEWEHTPGWLYYTVGAGVSWQNFGLAAYVSGTDEDGSGAKGVVALTVTVP